MPSFEPRCIPGREDERRSLDEFFRLCSAESFNGWHADHVYRHHSGAIECFLLLAFLAYNIFHAFFARNLKPEVRRGRTMEFWVRLIAAEIHALPRFSRTAAPP